MKTIDTLLASIGLLILRLGFGGFMLFAHGWGKLMGYSAMADKFPDPLGIGSATSLMGAITTEVFCSALIILGLFTRVVAVPAAFTMFIAFFVIHAQDDFATKEKALLYFTAYLALAFTGPGQFSLDRLIWKKKTNK